VPLFDDLEVHLKVILD